MLRSHCRPAAMVRPRLAFYKGHPAYFCRFFCTPEPQLSCGRNSLSASGIVREFSCGRRRGEQQSSTGDPGPRHEFGRVPPPHERRALHVRAAPGLRFNDMNNRVIAAARLPGHAAHCGEFVGTPHDLPALFPRRSHRNVAMREWRARRSKHVASARDGALRSMRHNSRAAIALRPSRSTAGLFPGFHRDRKPPMIYLNSGFDSCREGSPTGRGASHFQT